MEADALHDLTPGYALDALGPEDARAYEAHLARCARCRDELAELSEAAAALAYATEAPVPPPELRARIVQEAARERPNVVPLLPRWVKPVAVVAAVAACAAIGLGIWTVSLSSKLDRREAQLARQERVAQIVAQPGSRTISFARGTLIVGPNGEGALVLKNLELAGDGRTYEAWIAAEGAPKPAGLFEGGTPVAVPLDRTVPEGARVMVTREPAGGSKTPSSQPFVIVTNTAQS
jgi:anti-sigma-K factor RskA